VLGVDVLAVPPPTHIVPHADAHLQRPILPLILIERLIARQRHLYHLPV
jgi:hypothetical protein